MISFERIAAGRSRVLQQRPGALVFDEPTGLALPQADKPSSRAPAASRARMRWNMVSPFKEGPASVVFTLAPDQIPTWEPGNAPCRKPARVTTSNKTSKMTARATTSRDAASICG